MDITVANEAEMLALGRRIAAGLAPGQVIALCGGLGAGKTCLTRGLVAGLGHSGSVTSPTFSLVHEYRDGRMPVFHFDFYRLKSAAELEAIGWDEYLDEPGVVVAEWADLFPELLPPSVTWIRIENPESGGRRVRID